MAYTLTQARKLLTAAELQVFDASRAQPLRELTAARVRAKVIRARALRDKYRDLYRRQTVATRGAPARQRSATGGDNERTQHKADLFAEVLGRFEERLQRLDATAAAAESKAKSKSKATSRSTQPAKTAAKRPAAKAVPLKAAVAQAQARKSAANGKDTAAPARSAKAPARRASAATPATAPQDVAPGAKRANPLRQRSDNLAIHAHSKSQGRRAQGARDAR